MRNTRTFWRTFGVAAIIALIGFAASACRSPTAANVTYHTVTFDTGEGSAIASVQVPDGNTATRPEEDPTRDGYYFAGWYTCSDFTTQFNFNTPINGNTTVYARWTAQLPGPHTVTFYTGGGTEIDPVSVVHNQTVAIPEAPTRDDYHFAGWYTCNDFTTKFNFNTPITGAITIYARWSEQLPDPHTVTFNTGGGTEIDPVSVVHNQTVAIPEAPTRDDYHFAGWYTCNDFTTRFDFDTPINGNTTIYARWVREGEGLVFTFVQDLQGYMVVRFTGGVPFSPLVIPPQRACGTPVVAIAHRAFENSGISGNLIIPDSITTIRDAAFRGNEITGVTLGSGVAYIGINAFTDNEIETLEIPDSVTFIGNSAFRGNRLTALVIPGGITSLEIGVFSGNMITGEVVIPDNITSIGNNAFSGNMITGITIHNNVTFIGIAAFSSNMITGHVDIPNSVTGISRSTFWGNEITGVTIGSGVTYIGSDAFRNNRLTDITIGSGVTYIRERAFEGNRITSIDIPGNVNIYNSNSMGTYGASFLALYNRNGNLAGRYEFINSEWRGPDCAYPDCVCDDNGTPGLVFLRVEDSHYIVTSGTVSGDVVIPNYNNGLPVKSIANNALRERGITGITIGRHVTSIGAGAFDGNRISGVEIPPGVTFIGNNAFADNLITGGLVIPNNVTEIGPWAFRGNQITGVTIGNSVGIIGRYAFQNSPITAITIPANVLIHGTTSMGTRGISFHALYSANGRLPGRYEFVNGIWRGPDCTYPDCNCDFGTGELVFGTGTAAGVTQAFVVGAIGSALGHVVIPDYVHFGGTFPVVSIGLNSLQDRGITGITIGRNIRTISESALRDNLITEVIIPDNVTSIVFSAFQGNQITSVIIGNGITAIGQGVFRDNPITSITIPAGVNISFAPAAVAVMGIHGDSFRTLYNANGRLAGTYIFADGVWTLQQP